MILEPDFTVVAANDAVLRATDISRENLIGRSVFDALPGNPDAEDDSAAVLRASFERVRDTGRSETMSLFNYDVVDLTTGRLSTRYWSLVNAPVLDADGRCALIAQCAEDVTDYVLEHSAPPPASGASDGEMNALRWEDVGRRPRARRRSHSSKHQPAHRRAEVDEDVHLEARADREGAPTASQGHG